MRGLLRIFWGGMMVAITTLTSCRKPNEASKSDLGEADYKMTAADWFRASRSDDVAALKRFSAAGFPIDTRNETGDTALHAAASAGARNSAGFLLDHHLPVDVTGTSGRTPLMASVVANQTSMARWLIRQGADPRAKDKEGFTPLMLAVREGRSAAIPELAPSNRDSLDSAILLAALLGRTDVIDSLTNYGASVYARMEDGRTPLMVAAENGHTDSVKLLLDVGSSRFSTDNNGHTAAELAVSAGHPDTATVITQPPGKEDLALETPADVARKMDSFVDAAASENGDGAATADTRTQPGGTGPPPEPRIKASSPSKPIAGEMLGASVAAAEMSPAAETKSANSPPPSPATTASQTFPMPPLVMRHYREHEMPVQVRAVDGETATLTINRASQSEVKVRPGDTIPGSRLVVVRVQHRMESSKLNLGKPMDVSVVEVRDSTSGATREWISGVPSHAHDPVALVEDASTGKRYTATPGQRFKSADGTEFIVSDVRPNQIVIENAATGAVRTIPLRGPRG